MKKVSIVLRPTNLKISGDVIGVDAGALYCLNHNIEMLIALGDFDSITKHDLKRLEAADVTVIKFPEDKNEIDFELALDYAKEYDEVYIYGGLGNRRDHEYTLMRFVLNDPRLIVIDAENRIQMLLEGVYNYKRSAYRYLSLLPLSEGCISLTGFKYPLDHVSVDTTSNYLTSNEILEEGVITIHSGKVLVIQST